MLGRRKTKISYLDNQPGVAQPFLGLSWQRTQMAPPTPNLQPLPHPRLLGLRGTQSTRNQRSLATGHHHIERCQRSLGPNTPEKENNSSVPCLVAGVGRIQPSTTSDPNKSPGTGPLGTILVSEYRKWKRAIGRMVHGLGREANLKR